MINIRDKHPHVLTTRKCKQSKHGQANKRNYCACNLILKKKKKNWKNMELKKNIVEGKEKRGKSNDVTTPRNNRHIFVIVSKTCPIKSVP